MQQLPNDLAYAVRLLSKFQKTAGGGSLMSIALQKEAGISSFFSRLVGRGGDDVAKALAKTHVPPRVSIRPPGQPALGVSGQHKLTGLSQPPPVPSMAGTAAGLVPPPVSMVAGIPHLPYGRSLAEASVVRSGMPVSVLRGARPAGTREAVKAQEFALGKKIPREHMARLSGEDKIQFAQEQAALGREALRGMPVRDPAFALETGRPLLSEGRVIDMPPLSSRAAAPISALEMGVPQHFLGGGVPPVSPAAALPLTAEEISRILA